MRERGDWICNKALLFALVHFRNYPGPLWLKWIAPKVAFASIVQQLHFHLFISWHESRRIKFLTAFVSDIWIKSIFQKLHCILGRHTLETAKCSQFRRQGGQSQAICTSKHKKPQIPVGTAYYQMLLRLRHQDRFELNTIFGIGDIFDNTSSSQSTYSTDGAKMRYTVSLFSANIHELIMQLPESRTTLYM
jgi:hypothetical protein